MDYCQVLSFEWDEGNTAKCQKHGVTLAEIEAVFHHTPMVAPDIAHSQIEQRFIAIGKGTEQRLIFVVFTLRESVEGNLIRPISARYMHRKEIESYEKQTS
jgi:uncharacterized DUF497 family protein